MITIISHEAGEETENNACSGICPYGVGCMVNFRCVVLQFIPIR